MRSAIHGFARDRQVVCVKRIENPRLTVGDGAKFKGRGFIQLTGRANYASIGDRLSVDLLANPELANEPRTAARILALFVADREARILDALHADNLPVARKAVNGGTHGLDRFTATYRGALELFR
jgi:predicted chitinase